MSDTYAVKTKDPLGNTIVCTRNSWKTHILEDSEHTIMTGNEKAVEETLKDPDTICQSSQSKSRTVYFKKGATSSYSNELYTKVVTQETGEKRRVVVTAWPQKSIKGGISDVIYQKDE